MDFIGVVLMFLGLVGAVYAVVATGWFFPDTAYGRLCIGLTPYAVAVRLMRRRAGREASAAAASDVSAMRLVEREPAPVVAPAVAEVVTARPGRFLSIDGTEEQVQGSAMLLELQFFPGLSRGDKRHVNPSTGEQLREFKALSLAGNQLLVEHPSSEGGEMNFFLYEQTEVPTGFGEFLKGSDTNPGPAVRFAKSNQQETVTFPALGLTWRAKDIIWVDVDEHDGKFFVRPARDGSKARVAMLLAQSDEKFLLWADLRSGQGSDTLWIGRKFIPEGEIEL